MAPVKVIACLVSVPPSYALIVMSPPSPGVVPPAVVSSPPTARAVVVSRLTDAALPLTLLTALPTIPRSTAPAAPVPAGSDSLSSLAATVAPVLCPTAPPLSVITSADESLSNVIVLASADPSTALIVMLPVVARFTTTAFSVARSTDVAEPDTLSILLPSRLTVTTVAGRASSAVLRVPLCCVSFAEVTSNVPAMSLTPLSVTSYCSVPAAFWAATTAPRVVTRPLTSRMPAVRRTTDPAVPPMASIVFAVELRAIALVPAASSSASASTFAPSVCVATPSSRSVVALIVPFVCVKSPLTVTADAPSPITAVLLSPSLCATVPANVMPAASFASKVPSVCWKPVPTFVVLIVPPAWVKLAPIVVMAMSSPDRLTVLPAAAEKLPMSMVPAMVASSLNVTSPAESFGAGVLPSSAFFCWVNVPLKTTSFFWSERPMTAVLPST